MRSDRRSVYFAFQGLLTAVLLLINLLGQPGPEKAGNFWLLIAALAAPLLALRLVSEQVLGRWWFQTSFFLGDAALATLTLYWSDVLRESYLLYFLIIFGTALTRNFKQSMAVGLLTSTLFLMIAWTSGGFPTETAFWLRFLLLVISTIILSILSRDAQRTQAEQERRYQQRLIQAERLATLGQVAGEVAHRIKGPLTTIKVNAEVLSHRLRKSDDLKQLGEITEEVEHCKRILKGLLDLGRIEEMDFAPFDLRDPARFALRSVETQMKSQKIRLAVSGLDRPLPVVGDQSLLQEAIAALLQNAIDASRDGGRIALSAGRTRPGAIQLSIEDHGKGIGDEDFDRLFQPFFTTKGTDGSGLGLSAALRILQKHNGHIEAHSAGLGKGARFTMTLPAASRKS